MWNDYQALPMCPLFLFDATERKGELYNPGNGSLTLTFPKQNARSGHFPLHRDSLLSPEFAEYLHYLVTRHILFDVPRNNVLACVEHAEGKHSLAMDECNENAFSEFATIWLRASISFPGLPPYYDTIGFCMLDGALYGPLYCEVLDSAKWQHLRCR